MTTRNPLNDDDYTGNDAQISALKDMVHDYANLLAEILPFIEDGEAHGAYQCYKYGVVAKLRNKIRAAVAKTEQ